MSDNIDENDSENYDEDTSSTQDESEAEGKSSISADLIRGHINTIILRTLYEKDKYGYEIIAEIEQKSHGQYTLKQPTLYSALKRLESQGYIKAYWKTDEVSAGGRRKYFTLTDSGKEITEKNQAEWEYSRTVIDNLISDRSFDFSQPAPTPVDFKLLKNSVSRVPTQKLEETEDADNSNKNLTAEQTTLQQQVASTDSVVVSSTQATVTQSATQNLQTENVVDNSANARAEEERRIKHENYIKLISSPTPSPEAKKQDDAATETSDYTTDKLIYNNKPATERDYKNLIGSIFNRAIKSSDSQQSSQPVYSEQTTQPTYTQTQNVNFATEKAKADGLKVNTSTTENVRVRTANSTTIDLGKTLFKCSIIVGVVLLFEFVLLLIFKDNLNCGLGYPFVIFALAIAQLAIFGVLAFSGYGKNHTKPTTNNYISISVILTIIAILIICVIAFLINVNFASSTDILCKMVIPCLTTLAIPIFTLCFYFLIK